MNQLMNQVNILKKENEILKISSQLQIENDEIVLSNDPVCNFPLKYSWIYNLNSLNVEQCSPSFLLKGVSWMFKVKYKNPTFNITLNVDKNSLKKYTYDTYWEIHLENQMRKKIISRKEKFNFMNQYHQKNTSIVISKTILGNDNFFVENDEIYFKFIFTKIERLLVDENVSQSDSDVELFSEEEN
jgi:hypothetical protein